MKTLKKLMVCMLCLILFASLGLFAVGCNGDDPYCEDCGYSDCNCITIETPCDDCGEIDCICTPTPVGTVIITTASQLSNMTMNGTYRLGANLILDNWTTPIGTPNTPFTGTFYAEADSDFVIEYIEMETPYYAGGVYLAGLFGVNAGTIQNITIEEVVFELDSDNNEQSRVTVGSIAAINNGTITSATVESASIFVYAQNGGSRVGGITGRNSGSDAIVSYSIVKEIFISIESSNDDARSCRGAAGAVGLLENGATVHRVAVNYVDISAYAFGGGVSVAGLVGHFARGGTVTESFVAEGNVYATSNGAGTVYAGGLIANLANEAINVNLAPGYVCANLADSADEAKTVYFLIEDVWANVNATATSDGNIYAGLVARLDSRVGTNDPIPTGEIGVLAEITIRQAFNFGNSTGICIYYETGGINGSRAGGDNFYVGGIVSRMQGAGTANTIENVVAFGNVHTLITGSTNVPMVENVPSGDRHAEVAGVGRVERNAIVGRNQGGNIVGLWRYENITVTGNTTRATPNSDIAIDVTETQLQSQNWLENNLSLDFDIWAFPANSFPVLRWTVA